MKKFISILSTITISTIFAQESVTYTNAYWTGAGGNLRAMEGYSTDVRNYSTGVIPDQYTNLIFNKTEFDKYDLAADSTASQKGTGIQIREALTVHDYTIDSGYVGGDIRMKTGTSLTVKGDFTIKKIGTVQMFYDDAKGIVPFLRIEGDAYLGDKTNLSHSSTYRFGLNADETISGWGPLNTHIGGDLNIYTGSAVTLNGVTATTLNTGTNGSDAQFYIGGVINLVGGIKADGVTQINPTLRLVYRTYTKTDSNTGQIVNRPQSTFNVVSCNGLSGVGVVSSESTGTLEKSTGVLHLRNTQDQTFTGWIYDGNLNGKTMIIMEGTASQSFTGSDLSFTGGLEIRSGTIKFRRYDYNSHIQSDSHGTLTMKGGKFEFVAGNSYTQASSFGFDKIDYEDGLIALTIYEGENAEAVADTIKLHNGTISTAEDFAGKICFELDGYVEGLIDSYVKIVDWTEKTNLSNSQFYADEILNYQAVFDARDDGLYVKYAIPEPSFYAVIAGLFSLGLAIYRKRK